MRRQGCYEETASMECTLNGAGLFSVNTWRRKSEVIIEDHLGSWLTTVKIEMTVMLFSKEKIKGVNKKGKYKQEKKEARYKKQKEASSKVNKQQSIY